MNDAEKQIAVEVLQMVAKAADKALTSAPHEDNEADNAFTSFRWALERKIKAIQNVDHRKPNDGDE